MGGSVSDWDIEAKEEERQRNLKQLEEEEAKIRDERQKQRLARLYSIESSIRSSFRSVRRSIMSISIPTTSHRSPDNSMRGTTPRTAQKVYVCAPKDAGDLSHYSKSPSLYITGSSSGKDKGTILPPPTSPSRVSMMKMSGKHAPQVEGESTSKRMSGVEMVRSFRSAAAARGVVLEQTPQTGTVTPILSLTASRGGLSPGMGMLTDLAIIDSPAHQAAYSTILRPTMEDDELSQKNLSVRSYNSSAAIVIRPTSGSFSSCETVSSSRKVRDAPYCYREDGDNEVHTDNLIDEDKDQTRGSRSCSSSAGQERSEHDFNDHNDT
eukprot:CAMPEP_0182430108 /NCGR_PEP_ID=MMETSP1167-20130531/36947_1 /TAXON_ID=2988 /ORGANISM="Mallomonas Sp, Strain CCMP3275" /LENGTH=322 /DNA_ID=CAMNT_0024614783 /DNA_START=320 /DNA_END=1288 /DNA_ORIENTATION=-